MALLERQQVPAGHTWNLDAIYPAIEPWRDDLLALEKDGALISQFRGTLASSAEQCETAIRRYLDIGRRLEKVYVYARLLSDQDTADSTHLALVEQATNLYTRIAAEWSFLIPELIALSEETLALYLNKPSFADLKRLVLDTVRYKPHTLTSNEENIVALGTEVFGNADKIFSQLNNADLEFGTIEFNGEQLTLSHGSYVVLLKRPERALRQLAFERYYDMFDRHKNTIAATLSGAIKRDCYLAQIRNFPSARYRSLFADNVSENVYDSLVQTVSQGLAPLHRYYALRKKLLGLNEQRIFDTYVQLVPDVSVRTPYEEAVDLVVRSLAPLGEEYTTTLKAGLLNERWVDRYENKGKRSGAYSSGSYDTPPYILMNYKEDDIDQVFTLTHEAGHSMHTLYSCRNQPYQDHGYTIFVAEVASTLNEQLLMHHLMDKYRDDRKMIAYLLNQQIDDIKGTLFRQTMFAEFEHRTHRLAEEHQPLTVAVFRSLYRELLEKYFGPAVQVTALDELECLRIPHFYSGFYVYKYATGISAAIALSEQILSGKAGAVERYLRFLKSGGSKYPLDLLKDAGVDMESPQPVSAAVELFGRLVDRLDTLLSD